jgi:hypothetical protein
VTFYFRFEGFNYEVARAFAKGFDGEIVTIADISFLVIGETIVEETRFPIDGERWFKNRTLIGTDVKFFLKDEYRDEDLEEYSKV